MTNEILFLIFVALSLGFAFTASIFGQIWLKTYIVSCALVLPLTTNVVGDVLGWPVVMGTAVFGGIFFATDLLTERYGKKAGYQAIRLSIFAIIVYTLFANLTLFVAPLSESAEYKVSLAHVVSGSTRIIAAGLTAYFISQHFDVWFYHFIHEKTGERFLWLRNNLSTFTSQFIDTFLFSFLAFYSVMNEWIAIAFAGYVVKIIVAACDTGFIYIAKMITPFDLKQDTQSITA